MYAPNEIMNRAALLQGFYAPFAGSSPGVVGLEDCESRYTHLKERSMITEKNLARHYTSTQTTLEREELGNALWLPRPENSTYGRTEA